MYQNEMNNDLKQEVLLRMNEVPTITPHNIEINIAKVQMHSGYQLVR